MFRKSGVLLLTFNRRAYQYTVVRQRSSCQVIWRTMPLRLAVIGAGAAGICAMRHIVSRPDIFEGVCFEQCPQVGGTWIYTDRVGRDEFGLPVHSSMYKNLKTNLPKEVMAFPDFPFDKSLPSFIRHQDVLQYLQDYSQHFHIVDKIKFQTKVEFVDPVKDDSTDVKWNVTYSDVLNPEDKKTEIFDGIIVCNGHYSLPLSPAISGLDKFKGQIFHSHDYREPNGFKNQRVAVLGARSSGLDIMVELSSVADKVFISHNNPSLSTMLPSNVEQRPGITGFTEDSVIFSNQQEEKIDSVIFCTGYKYDFSFLSEACNIKIENERVTPLYKHLIHTEFPNFSIIGVCKVIVPLPQFHFQVLVALSVLDGSLKLPSKDDMEQDTESDFQNRLSQGMPARYAHHMGPRQWAYNDELADMAQCPRLEKRVMDIYNTVHGWRAENCATYKSRNIALVDPDSFQILE